MQYDERENCRTHPFPARAAHEGRYKYCYRTQPEPRDRSSCLRAAADDADCHDDGHQHAFAHTNGDGNRDTEPDCHGDGFADPEPDGDFDAHGDADGHEHADGDANAVAAAAGNGPAAVPDADRHIDAGDN